MAGGLNLYGFASGDPVNFSDPFGLCPIEVDGIPCGIVYARGTHAITDRNLVNFLNGFAREQNRNVLVRSGTRTAAENDRVRGARNSCHLRGCGADIRLDGATAEETLGAVANTELTGTYGIRTIYHAFGSTHPEHVHVDTRNGPDLVEPEQKRKPGKPPTYVEMRPEHIP